MWRINVNWLSISGITLDCVWYCVFYYNFVLFNTLAEYSTHRSNGLSFWKRLNAQFWFQLAQSLFFFLFSHTLIDPFAVQWSLFFFALRSFCWYFPNSWIINEFGDIGKPTVMVRKNAAEQRWRRRRRQKQRRSVKLNTINIAKRTPIAAQNITINIKPFDDWLFLAAETSKPFSTESLVLNERKFVDCIWQLIVPLDANDCKLNRFVFFFVI